MRRVIRIVLIFVAVIALLIRAASWALFDEGLQSVDIAFGLFLLAGVYSYCKTPASPNDSSSK